MKKLLSVILSAVMVLTMLSCVVVTAGAEDEAENIRAICLWKLDEEENNNLIIYSDQEGTETDTVSGFVYNESTNTLNVTNVDMPTYGISACCMGADFKINISGEVHVALIDSTGGNHVEQSVELTGNGHIYLNEENYAVCAIDIFSDGSDSVLKIDDTVAVTAFGGIEDEFHAGVFSVTGSYTENYMDISGITQDMLYEDIGEEVNTESGYMLEPVDLFTVTAVDKTTFPGKYAAFCENDDEGYYLYVYELTGKTAVPVPELMGIEDDGTVFTYSGDRDTATQNTKEYSAVTAEPVSLPVYINSSDTENIYAVNETSITKTDFDEAGNEIFTDETDYEVYKLVSVNYGDFSGNIWRSVASYTDEIPDNFAPSVTGNTVYSGCVETDGYSNVRGDIEIDGKITVADARLALRQAVMLENYEEGSFMLSCCDYNGDGEVKVDDARLILRTAVGLPN